MRNEKSKIDELNDTLNSRTEYSDPVDRRTPVPPREAEPVEETWQSPKLDDMLAYERRKPEESNLMKKILIVAFSFFFVAVTAAAYIYLGGGNFISSKNVDIKVSGSTSVAAGDVLELNITVENKNNADLEVANLAVEYPEGTRNPDDATKDIGRTKIDLGKIEAGGKAAQTVRAVFFGEREDVKPIRVLVEYQVTGSNATFYKEKVYEVVIGSAPVSITATRPGTVTSGDSFEVTLTLAANSSTVLKNIIVRGEYPYGFSLSDATPRASGDDNTWFVGDLSPGDKKTITLRGSLLGENKDERTFRFYAGVARADNPEEFDTALASLSETFSIDRPSVGLSIRLNGGDSRVYVAPAGQRVNGSVNISNNLPQRLVNARVELALSGPALDRFSINAGNGGFYNSQNNTIVWDKNSTPQLADIGPGDSGIFSFYFASLEGSSSRNQEIAVKATVTGTPQGESASGAVRVADERSVRIASQVNIASKALYSTGVFENTGPIPPKADTKTSYTIVFTAGNTTNDIENAKITAVLGQNVEWKAQMGGEDVSYDENTRIVTWNMGKLVSGTGFSMASREATFQIEIMPSIGQIKSTPILVNNISFSGTDIFTGVQVALTRPAITTRISEDPVFVQGDEVVVK